MTVYLMTVYLVGAARHFWVWPGPASAGSLA